MVVACNSLLHYDGMFDVDNIVIITLVISYLNRSTRASMEGMLGGFSISMTTLEICDGLNIMRGSRS